MIWKILSGFIVGIIVSSIYFNYNSKKVYTPIHDTVEIYIDKVQEKIDTIFITKTKLKYIYEKKQNQIDTMSNDSLWKFYTNFLQSRFPSNTNTIKAD